MDKRQTKGEIISSESDQVYRQYSPDGLFVAEYVSVKLAALHAGISETSIRRCLLGKRCMAGHFFWRKEDKDTKPYSPVEMEPVVLERKAKEKFTRQRAVQMVDPQTGKIIKEYTSINEAARNLGIDKKCIFDVLRGLQKQAGGYAWVEIKESRDI